MSDFLTYREISQRLGYKDTSIVRKLVKQGLLTPVQLIPGGRPRISCTQFNAYIQSVTPNSPQQAIDALIPEAIQAQDDLQTLIQMKRKSHVDV